MNKIIISCFLALLILACAGKENTKVNPKDVADGQLIYKKYCVLCHGIDGKLGVNDSKDINLSTLTLEERKVMIRDGKKLMTPFEGVLTEEEIHAVAAYTMTMKN